METNIIHHANSFDFIETLPDESIDLVLTSPPFWKLRTYTDNKDEFGQEEHLEDYLQKLWKLMYSLTRLVKPTGSIVINIGDKCDDYGMILIPYRFAMEANDEDCKLINIIHWVKKNPTPKPLQGNKLTPSVEAFFHFVKSKNYYYNLDAFQRKKSETLVKKPNTNIGKKYFAMIQVSNLTDEQKVLAEKELRDAIEEVKEGKIMSFRMKIRGMHALPYGGQAGGRMSHITKKGFTLIKFPGTKSLKRDVIECSVESLKGNGHPAIFPEKIVKEILYLLTQPNDIVLDPFCGSGTTCVVAKAMNRRYVGIEINESYVKKAKERL